MAQFLTAVNFYFCQTYRNVATLYVTLNQIKHLQLHKWICEGVLRGFRLNATS